MAIYPEAHPKATEESFPVRNLGSDPNRACVLPALLRTQRVWAIFFLRLPSALVPHVFMDLRTFVSDKKSKIPVFSRLRIFEARIPGCHMQCSRSRLVYPRLALARPSLVACFSRQNSQGPLNATLL